MLCMVLVLKLSASTEQKHLLWALNPWTLIDWESKCRILETKCAHIPKVGPVCHIDNMKQFHSTFLAFFHRTIMFQKLQYWNHSSTGSLEQMFEFFAINDQYVCLFCGSNRLRNEIDKKFIFQCVLYKFRGTGLQYEVADLIHCRNIMWMYGAFPRGNRPNLKFLKKKLSIVFHASTNMLLPTSITQKVNCTD